ncbi:MAG TPA: hypothetical protein VGD17_07920 [Chitinophagaceae bacterium]
MKRILSFVITVSSFFVGYSQPQFGHELQLTETRFALESQIHGLKWGFLHNMDTTAVGLNPTGFTNLYRSWQARPDNSGFVLLWKPIVGYWSTNGLFGITSGPFYTKPSPDSSLIHPGYFFTVWQRNELSKPFRISLDIGVQLRKPAEADSTRDADVKLYPLLQRNGDKQLVTASVNSRSVFSGFSQKASQESLSTAFATFANEKTYILVSGSGPVTWEAAKEDQKFTGKLTLNRSGARTLGPSSYFEWGTFNDTRTGNKNATGYFVHVWTFENSRPVLTAVLYNFN